jgi:predicted glycogen debranching enzyme
MLPVLSPSILHRFDQAVKYEWLETNGLGGYASSTVIGALSRRYHGLLVAATRPPVNRVVMLSKWDETICVGDKRYELGTNKYRGTVYPNGYIFQRAFEQEMFPSFTYEIGGISLRKTIAAIHGENTIVITYAVEAATQPFEMELLPLYSPRDYHHLAQANGDIDPQVDWDGEVLATHPYPDQPWLYLQVPGGQFISAPDWYYQLEYGEELARGQGGHEDLFSPGHFRVSLKAGDRLGLIVSTQPAHGRDAFALLQQEQDRREALQTHAGFDDPLMRRLVLASDQFVVQRGKDLKTIIAGYHWFTDWGRDTMISLPGLCLATRRFEDARKILLSFAQATDQGMIPNRFPDNGASPLYNTIDGTLWFFVAVYKYLQATQDLPFVASQLLPVLGDILAWHQRGTRFSIRMDEDGLLSGGEDSYALTWMDAKAGDWVVTPRRGKAVEINALWYNAWRIYGYLLKATQQESVAHFADQQAETIRQSFIQQFWNEHTLALYDVIDGDHKDDAIRPNQIFALSLPFPLLEVDQAYQVLDRIERELLTPVGLRSLSPDDQGYLSVYGGDQVARDGAYHQGTVWSWLLGPYLDALIRVRGGWGQDMAMSILQGVAPHLGESGMGSISEIFDGGGTNQPRGCVAQAWSVAELIRVASEYQLYPQQKKTEPTQQKNQPQVLTPEPSPWLRKRQH